MKPILATAASSPAALSPPLTLTSKEWIVPPRPKPGRKPATDTPPTKRKAQNRAAQRAFRERRAARVGELEEQLKEVEDQNDQEQDVLRATITEMEQSLERCRNDLSSWMAKCQKLEVELIQAREQLTKQCAPPSTPAVDVHSTEDSDPIGCGKCTLDTHCQCIDDVVKGMAGDVDSSTSKRGLSPTISAHKRIKLEAADYDNMEIDFTAQFSRTAAGPARTHTSAVVLDPCGFCQDGTPCICAEMAAEQERQNATQPSSPIMNNRPGQRQLSQFTPPPSEGDVASSGISAILSCASGPGTCAQCRADPNSTLFCKSLAASREKAGGSSGCCGGRDAQGGCCQSSVPLTARTTRSRASANMNMNMRLPPPNARNPVTLSCADAYTALSRHAGYEQASGDMASWMPKLQANPASTDGRPAMEIDAANVMAVLKDFDRRFGANK